MDRDAKARITHVAGALMRPTEPGRHYGQIAAKALSLANLVWAGKSCANNCTTHCLPGWLSLVNRSETTKREARDKKGTMLGQTNSSTSLSSAIRIVLDPRERHDFVALGDLADNVRIKRGGPYMHLKAYSIDGQVLRTGSANFSTSGEHQQDNDLVIIRDAGIAAKFDAHFERMWDAAQPMIEFEPAIKALEPK